MKPTLSIAELEARLRDVSRTDTAWEYLLAVRRGRRAEEDSESYLRRREPLPRPTGVTW